jgi:tryptophan synthase alpha chain
MLPESDDEFMKAAKTHGIDTIFLATPVTKQKRVKKITSKTSGFLYLTSVTGITGQRESVNSELKSFAEEIKKETDLPVCVGFGISSKEHVENIASFADGVIVGSAIVNKIIENDDPLSFIKKLYSGVKK